MLKNHCCVAAISNSTKDLEFRGVGGAVSHIANIRGQWEVGCTR